nr:hypothetical protein asmbl_13 [uncultured bacterium]
MTAVNRFLGGMTSFSAFRWWFGAPGSDLRDLGERQLDRRLAAEDGHEDLQLLLLGVDLVDRGRQGREGPVHDGDRLADLEVDDRRGATGDRGGGLRGDGGRLGRGRGDQQVDDLVDAQRGRPRRGADEPGDPGGVADRTPGLVVEVHPDEQVPGQLLAVDLGPLAVLDLGDLLGGHLDLEDVVLHVQRLDAGLEVGLHLVLVARVGVDDVPVAELLAERGAEGLARVLVRLGRGLERLGDQRVVVGGRRGQGVAHQAVPAAGLDRGGQVGDAGGGVLVRGVGRALGGAGLTGAGLEVDAAAHVGPGVVEVDALDGAVGLEGLAGVGHYFSSLALVGVVTDGAVSMGDLASSITLLLPPGWRCRRGRVSRRRRGRPGRRPGRGRRRGRP